MMTDELWSRALALPASERAELAHALMDSLYEDVDWDTGAGCRTTQSVSIAAAPPRVAEVIELMAVRASRRP